MDKRRWNGKKKVKKRRKGKRKYEKRYQMNSSINFFHIHPHLYLSSVLMKYRKSRERECLRWFYLGDIVIFVFCYGLVWFNWFHVWCVQQSFGFLIFFSPSKEEGILTVIFFNQNNIAHLSIDWLCHVWCFQHCVFFFYSFLLILDITWFFCLN